MRTYTYRKDNFIISTDKSILQIDVIYNFLTKSYWAKGITRDTIEFAIDNSYCFGVYKNNKQIGFARIITDYSTFAYLRDVFILEEYRGLGLSKWLMEIIMNCPDLLSVNSWMLRTKDAHGLYRKYGFEIINDAEKFMSHKR